MLPQFHCGGCPNKFSVIVVAASASLFFTPLNDYELVFLDEAPHLHSLLCVFQDSLLHLESNSPVHCRCHCTYLTDVATYTATASKAEPYGLGSGRPALLCDDDSV